MLLRHVLTPPPADLPRVVRADLVGGETAFDALRAAGHLVTLAPGAAVLPGTAVTPGDRLTALAARIPPRTVVGRLSAVWVLTGEGDPTTLTVLYSPRTHRPGHRADLSSHQATLRDDDVEGLGPLRVTGPLRTAFDLARHVPRATALPALARLVADARLDPALLVARLRTHAPGPLAAEALDVAVELRARLGT